jgi:phosphatidate cytidylyltransferase
MTFHLKRWITGIVAVPLLFGIIYYGSNEIFFLLIVSLTLCGIAEYNILSFDNNASLEKIQGFVAAVVLPLAAFAGGLNHLISAVTLLFIATFIIFLGSEKCDLPDMSRVSRVAFGILYIPLMMSHVILLREHPQGVLWILFMLILAFSGDITAFYVGRMFGKKKLLPHVSAGKTVAGTIGSVLGSIIGCIVFNALLFNISFVHAALMGFLGNIIGELGDLCESVLKRSAGVKDSGAMFPGHGGVLDRLDCILFIAPCLFYYRFFIIG